MGGAAHAGSKRASGVASSSPSSYLCLSIPFVGKQAARCLVISNHRVCFSRAPGGGADHTETCPHLLHERALPQVRGIYSPRGGLACHLHHQAVYGSTVSRPRIQTIWKLSLQFAPPQRLSRQRKPVEAFDVCMQGAL